MASNVPCLNPECGARLDVKAEMIGRRLRCGVCGFKMIIEESGGEIRVTARDDSKESIAARPAAPRPTRFGRYEIRRLLGSGAFGLVYRAYDPMHGREVALKIPREGSCETSAEVERFLREARVVSLLDHPHIVPAHEFGVEEGKRYFASAFVDGRTLSRAIDGRGLGHRLAARVAREIAEALQHAHDLGIVHRDVKPSNVMLDQDGRAHLMDFGLARLAESEVRLTQDGFILGTPSYLAPEQALGKSADAEAACDQYGLGATLYQMLAGHPPFVGPIEIVLFATIHQPPPSLRSQDQSVPADLEAICFKALAKQPADRYSSCREMAEDLGRWLAQEPTLAGRPVQPPEPARTEPNPEVDSILSVKTADESVLVPPRQRLRLGSRPLLLMISLVLLGLIYVATDDVRKARRRAESELPTVNRTGGAVKPLASKPIDRSSRKSDEKPIPTGIAQVIRESTASDERTVFVQPEVVARLTDASNRPPPRIYRNSIGMSFALILPDAFTMGASPSDPWANDEERPSHRVEIRRRFSMGVTEVTRSEYAKILDANWEANARYLDNGLLPKVGVRWADAVTFCKMLSKKEGLVYRLPTEAEWEYACRAGTHSTWSWGDDGGLAQDYGWFAENSSGTLQPVRQKKPNAFGLYDMQGNAWEWCLDFGRGSLGFPFEPELQVDPLNTQAGPNRLLRGGSFHHDPLLARSGARNCSYPPSSGFDDFGFRVVCEGPLREESGPAGAIAKNQAATKSAEGKSKAATKTARPAIATVDAEGFFPLYSGGDPLKQGWRMIGSGGFDVEAGGVLKARGGPGYLAYTRTTFGDFRLAMDVQFSRPADESGIFFGLRSLPPDIHLPKSVGYEVELSGDVERPSATGSLYSERAWFHGPEKTPPQRPIGEWNRVGIKVVGRTLEVWVNDERVKTETLPEASVGSIAIQNYEDGPIKFRNIRIMAD